ncbi:hypothetical protein F8C76_01540 [Flagellimonas olearia]|uniref:Lipocalin-like domain-containing protein n=1 Tax=Flagellimonas olearia TaxID=552546 RepID=A0A6I1E1C2_9FLAO|nr:hypothetical protein [Allomuricauda olearia]KAB7530219.1 hypothetical protein F8C76_01540 [Allomuricauda olearia]
MNFRKGTFTGESETEKFPAICRGSYAISEGKLDFTNTCHWTAEFDWSLILHEEWNYDLKGSTLILTKSNGDRYTLTKQ